MSFPTPVEQDPQRLAAGIRDEVPDRLDPVHPLGEYVEALGRPIGLRRSSSPYPYLLRSNGYENINVWGMFIFLTFYNLSFQDTIFRFF